MYNTLLSPMSLGSVTLKNRIIFAPTTMGLPEEEYYRKIEAIAAGGCAMIIIGDVPVLPTRFGHSLYSKKGFAHYRKLADLAHRHNCLICAQLHQSDTNIRGMLKYIPGILTKRITPQELRPLLNAQVSPYITRLSLSRIYKITSAFGEAAALAREAGFDMVQVHGDRMCGSFVPVLLTTAQTATAAASKTGHVSLQKQFPLSAIGFRIIRLTISLPSARKIHTTEMPAYWTPNWKNLSLSWKRPASPAFM